MQQGGHLRERLRSILEALDMGLVERKLAVRMALLAALSGEHVLLIGPPGTAKSLIARRLREAFDDASFFERLLTRFSVPEELFGPLSIKGLEEDRYERLIQSYLPSASIAFLDEIFKANSAILNALLTLLNEREFDNGAKRQPTPLIAVIGASNELPEGNELNALYDRFLLRVHVAPVSTDGFPALLSASSECMQPLAGDLKLSQADLQTVRLATESIEVSPQLIGFLSALREWCQREELQISDRRWRKILGLLKTSALTNGRDHVAAWDLWLLQHCLWQEPDQQARIAEWIITRVERDLGSANSTDRILRIVVALEDQVYRDQRERSQRRNRLGEVLYIDTNGELTNERFGRRQRERERHGLYLAPKGAHLANDTTLTPIHDRTNNNEGYTRAELKRFAIGSVDFANWNERSRYLNDPANWISDPVSLEPAMEPKRYAFVYIAARQEEIESLRHAVTQERESLRRQLEEVRRDVHQHLWIADDFAQRVKLAIKAALSELELLDDRIDGLRESFKRLPREAARSPQPESAKRGRAS